MCVVSMVMDHYHEKWSQPPYKNPLPNIFPLSPITNEEIAEFRKLLERAREYDKRNNEPDCELEEKRRRLLDLARELGVKIEVLGFVEATPSVS